MIGGSIENANIAGRLFAVAADADGSRNLGGYQNAYEANGDGTGRKIMTRMGWGLSGLQLSIDDSAGDDEFLQEVIDRKEFVVMSFTLASGEVYQGQGTIVDENPTSTQNTTKTISCMGPGKLTKQ